VGGERGYVESLEPFNPSKKMTRWGWHVQCNCYCVIANNLPPPESQLHTHTCCAHLRGAPPCQDHRLRFYTETNGDSLCKVPEFQNHTPLPSKDMD
jgi:hypothetical protein